MSERPKLKAKDAPELGRFDWEDPFRLDLQLTEEERMLRNAAHSYAQEKLQPRVIEAFETEHTDPEIFREMGAMGLLGVTIPEEYGGIGAGYVSWPGRARDRACGLGLSQHDVRAELTRHVSDLCLWERGAEDEVPA
jgi:glutaryl-CoA dehydrogenase